MARSKFERATMARWSGPSDGAAAAGSIPCCAGPTGGASVGSGGARTQARSPAAGRRPEPAVLTRDMLAMRRVAPSLSDATWELGDTVSGTRYDVCVRLEASRCTSCAVACNVGRWPLIDGVSFLFSAPLTFNSATTTGKGEYLEGGRLWGVLGAVLARTLSWSSGMSSSRVVDSFRLCFPL